MNNKFTSSVAGASIFITLTGLISRGLGFIREIIFASSFGLSTAFDIYLIGAVLPITINTIILYLALNYLIPAYNNIRSNDPEQAENFIGINLVTFFTGGLLLSLVLFFFSDSIISFYLHNASADTIDTAKTIFNIFLLSIPLNSIVAVITAEHQIHLKFNFPAYSQLVVNIVIIAVVLIFTTSLNIYVIPAAYVSGSLCQMIYLLVNTRSRIKLTHLRSLLNDIKKYVPASLFFIILIEGISQLYMIVDRYFYNYVPAGGIAALNYAQTIFLLPISIITAALSTAIFPKFAHYISEKLNKELEDLFNQSIMVNIALFVPITIIFLFYGDFIIKLIFERGKFTQSDTMLTYHALGWYSISLLFYAVYGVLNKILYSIGLLKILLYITITGILIKILVNVFTVDTMHQNGLALSTSVSYIFFFAVTIMIIYSKIEVKNKTVFIKELFFHGLNGIFSLFITKVISILLPFSGWTLLSEILIFSIIYLFNLIMSKHSIVKIVEDLMFIWKKTNK